MSFVDPNFRKPCIALMGEFSAGKSTLANLLIGSDPVPVQVIATQLPPVWISYGDEEPYRVDLEGNRKSVDIHNLVAAPLSETAYIKLHYQEDVLQHCDLLDLPGISDPNMSSVVWERMLHNVHGVIWCSHATQAWRQSEAAVWESLPDAIYAHSLLLLTRADKLTTEEDLDRVVRRVRRETRGLFRACLPISLLQATSEQKDYDLWLRSGAGEFARQFASLLVGLNEKQVGQGKPIAGPAIEDLKMPSFDAPDHPDKETIDEENKPKVIPRRVQSYDT